MSAKIVTMRQFIESSLYGANGFFRNANLLIAATPPRPTTTNATRLNNAVGLAYQSSAPESQFATASTTFRHDGQYAAAVRAWLADRRSVRAVVEVGGGSGALACDLLADCEQIAAFHHVEISPELAQAQRAAALAAGVAARHRVHTASFFDWKWTPFRTSNDGSDVAILAFEVLDNLACDKLVVLPHGAGAKQAFVELRTDGTRVEVFRDVTDHLVQRCLALWLATHAPPADLPRGFVLWLPTGTFQFVEHVKAQFGPKASILIADFDDLPTADGGVIGVNAPIVQRKQLTPNDTVQSFPDVLRAPAGHCDIFFPTSFEFVRRCFGEDRDLLIEKHSDYLSRFAPQMSRAARKFYGNMSVLRSR